MRAATFKAGINVPWLWFWKTGSRNGAAKNEVLAILRTLRNEHYGVLVVSSEPETILAVSDQVLVMSHGRIVAQLENKGLNKDSLMRLI